MDSFRELLAKPSLPSQQSKISSSWLSVTLLLLPKWVRVLGLWCPKSVFPLFWPMDYFDKKCMICSISCASTANSSCDSCFHNRASYYQKIGWLQYIQHSHSCSELFWKIFRNCGNVKCTVITLFCDKGAPHYKYWNTLSTCHDNIGQQYQEPAFQICPQWPH